MHCYAILESGGNVEKAAVACLWCQKVFMKQRKHQKFCSPECRFQHWTTNNPRVRLADLKKLEAK